MINPKLIGMASSIVAALRPLLFATIGGLVAGGVQRCEKSETVNLIVTNQQYESQISRIQARQDSLATVLPSMAESLRFLSERYDRKP